MDNERMTSDLNTTRTVNNAPTVWHAIYTRPRHEKAVAKQLDERRVEVFLPTYGKLHRWKDRNKLVIVPLFPGYVFVRILRGNCLPVLQVGGVVRFVGFGGSPAEIPDTELQALRAAVEAGAALTPHRFLKVGQRVRVCHGPLQNAEGILIRKKSGHRLVLSLDLIQRSVAVEMNAADVVSVSEVDRGRARRLHPLGSTSPWLAPGSIY